jgi:multidrug efflux pump subunit AcrB
MKQPLDLSPVITPDAPTWWPLAWGWWAVIVIAITLIALVFFIVKRRKNNQLPKQEALSYFSNRQSSNRLSPSEAQRILRQAALSYFPREKVAGLSGDDWLAFLDAQLAKPLFSVKQSQWQQALYQDAFLMTDEQKKVQQQLVNDCETWLRKALPPKRGNND